MSRSHPSASADADLFFVALAAVTRGIRAGDRLTQEELARRAGFGANFVSAVEHARADPTFTRLVRLAHGLGLGGIRELLLRVDDAAQRLTAAANEAPPGPSAT